MASIALPIRELELSVRVSTDRARAEAECVIFYSQARSIEPVRMTVKFGLTALLLKYMLGSLARHQRALIRAYQVTDFNEYTDDQLLKWADPLLNITDKGRAVLCKLEKSDPYTQRLFGPVLGELADQLNHMESIAHSLRSAADPEASLLMGLAIQAVAAN